MENVAYAAKAEDLVMSRRWFKDVRVFFKEENNIFVILLYTH